MKRKFAAFVLALYGVVFLGAVNCGCAFAAESMKARVISEAACHEHGMDMDQAASHKQTGENQSCCSRCKLETPIVSDGVFLLAGEGRRFSVKHDLLHSPCLLRVPAISSPSNPQAFHSVSPPFFAVQQPLYLIHQIFLI